MSFIHWEFGWLLLLSILLYGAAGYFSTELSWEPGWKGYVLNRRKFAGLLFACVLSINFVTVLSTNVDIWKVSGEPDVCTGVHLTNLLLLSTCSPNP